MKKRAVETKRRVLVVDDDPVQARISARIGRFGGFEVREAHGAVEAARLARDWKPELIISDVVMPELDGGELCVVLKSQPETREIPILLVSAFQEEAVPLGEFTGAADILAKPYTPVQLLRTMNRLLDRVRV